MFDYGDTFYGYVAEIVDSKTNIPHLHLIISHKEEDRFVVVLVSTDTDQDFPKQNTCHLEKGDHSSIQHRSAVMYSSAKLIPLSKLVEWEEKGLVIKKEHLSKDVLARVIDGAARTDDLGSTVSSVLIRQGLIKKSIETALDYLLYIQKNSR